MKNRFIAPILVLTLSTFTFFGVDIFYSFFGESCIDYKLIPLNTSITSIGINSYSFVPIEVEDRCEVEKEGLPIYVYASDKLDTIYLKTIVEYGIQKDEIIFHVKDITDTEFYILRVRDEYESSIKDSIILSGDFTSDEYLWIKLQESDIPWLLVFVIFLFSILGIVLSVVWMLFLVFRKFLSTRLLISTLLVGSICCLSIDICYFSYKGASMGSYDYLLPFNTHIYCLGDRYSFKWIGGNYCEFMSEGLPINVIAENGEVQTINQKTVLQYGFKRKELVYQIESIEGDRYYIQKVDRNNDYLIAEEDFNYDDYRWKDFEHNTTYRVLGIVMLLGLLVAIVSAALLAIYLITAQPLHKK